MDSITDVEPVFKTVKDLNLYTVGEQDLYDPLSLNLNMRSTMTGAEAYKTT